jgi:hypothetical protein
MFPGNTDFSTDNKSIKEININLHKLSDEISESNAKSETLNRTMLSLTWVMAGVAAIELFTKVAPSIWGPLEDLFFLFR